MSKCVLCGLEEGVLGLELVAEELAEGFAGLDVGDDDLMGVAAEEEVVVIVVDVFEGVGV
jgi:hypothetical protein